MEVTVNLDPQDIQIMEEEAAKLHAENYQLFLRSVSISPKKFRDELSDSVESIGNGVFDNRGLLHWCVYKGNQSYFLNDYLNKQES